MEGFVYVIIALVVFILAVIAANVKIVPQSKAYVIERLGTYQSTWQTGLHIKIPIFERVAKIVSLKEQIVDFKPQPVITKDNVTMRIDTVVYFQITDPKLFVYGVDNPIMAIENLTATTLRNIIGDLELDETLTSRETINTKMRIFGCGNGPLGNQGKPCGIEKHYSTTGNSGCHGKTDEGRT